jgi:hypothetical protein
LLPGERFVDAHGGYASIDLFILVSRTGTRIVTERVGTTELSDVRSESEKIDGAGQASGTGVCG